jgi:hypothetical protein
LLSSSSSQTQRRRQWQQAAIGFFVATPLEKKCVNFLFWSSHMYLENIFEATGGFQHIVGFLKSFYCPLWPIAKFG